MALHWFSHACHEAGHAIAAWYSGRVLHVASAQVGRTEGFVAYETLSAFEDTPASLWARLVIKVAGIAGAFRYGYRVQALNCEADLESARVLARQLSARCDVRQALPAETGDRATITRMYVEEPSAGERHAIEAAYLKARALLACYRYEHLAVAIALVVCRELDASSLEELLGPRQIGKVFVMPRAGRRWSSMLGRLLRLGWARLRRKIRYT